ILNYGHTLGHALEIATNYDMTHGECIGVGLVFAAELACRLGRIDRKRVDEHRSTVGTYDLPMQIPDGIDDGELVELMGRDKKAITGITFVLDGPDGVEPITGVRTDDIRSALEAVR